MAQVTISDRVPPRYQNRYVAHITVYHMNLAQQTTSDLETTSAKQCARIIQCLDHINKTPEIYDAIKTAPYFDELFVKSWDNNEFYVSVDARDDGEPKIYWPFDGWYAEGGVYRPARYYNHRVYWYDKDGIPHYVHLKEEK